MLVMQNLPFDTFTKPYAVSFLCGIRPAYKPPSAYLVTSKYIPRLHEEVMSKVAEQIVSSHSPAVGMSSDGWTNVSGEGCHNVMLGSPLQFLLGTFDMKNSEQRKDDLLEQVRRMIATADQYYVNARLRVPSLFGFVVDNPSVNKGLRKLADKDETLARRLVMYGCPCHSLNNHGSDVTKLRNIPEVNEATNRVVKFFRNTVRAREYLQDAHEARSEPRYKLQPGSDTRWNYILRVLQSLLRSEQAIRDVGMMHAHKRFDPPIPSSFDEKPGKADDGSTKKKRKTSTARSKRPVTAQQDLARNGGSW